MVKSSFEKNRLALEFSDEELLALELNQQTGFEIVKAKKGVWVLFGSPKDAPQWQLNDAAQKQPEKIDENEQKIAGMLLKKPLKERVEGEFEKLLSAQEQETFKKMLEQNRVEKFRLNESYKKAVYQLRETADKKVFEEKEKSPEEYTLENDGFLIAKTEFAAQKFSALLGEKIKSGEVRGTRAFSGEFFIIDTHLFDQKAPTVTEFLKAKKTATLTELMQALKMTPILIKIICTFLSEDGIILERRKEQFVFIE